MYPPDFKTLKRFVSQNTLSGVLESLANIEAQHAMLDNGNIEPRASARMFALMRFAKKIEKIEEK